MSFSFSSVPDNQGTERKVQIDWAALHAGRAEAVAKKWKGMCTLHVLLVLLFFCHL